MSFELLNALASFQGYINKILAKKLNFFFIIYLNNICQYHYSNVTTLNNAYGL